MSRIINAAASNDDDLIETADNCRLGCHPVSRFAGLRPPMDAAEPAGYDIKNCRSTATAANTIQVGASTDYDGDPAYRARKSAVARSSQHEPKLRKWLFRIAHGEAGQGTNLRALAKKIQDDCITVTIPDDIDKTFRQAIEDRRCMLRYVIDGGTAFEECMDSCQEVLDG